MANFNVKFCESLSCSYSFVFLLSSYKKKNKTVLPELDDQEAQYLKFH